MDQKKWQLVGQHPLMEQVLEKIRFAAPSRSTVLIHGETGTGKELIARAIHDQSPRRNGPFIRLNCASLSDSLLESELFGHEKGAFTGAISKRIGRFELAHQGTLFLDEISEVPLSMQVKLLRFLQEREFERVGGSQTIEVDVRIVAATNKDLHLLVQTDRFRQDLYFRLKVIMLEIPPLRLRPSDIPILAGHFLKKFADENEKRGLSLDEEALKLLLDYPWPGNVRELEHTLEHAVVFCEGQTVGVKHLSISEKASQKNPFELMIPGVTLAEIERYAILRTLEAAQGSTAKAAEILGVSQRTIQYRLKEWGMTAATEIIDLSPASSEHRLK